jgi:hypothetical protein
MPFKQEGEIRKDSVILAPRHFISMTFCQREKVAFDERKRTKSDDIM